VTPAQLAALAPNCDAETIAPALTAAADEFHINTPLRLAHWLAQLDVESAGFTRMVENLNYSAERLCQVWPARFPSLDAAQPFAHQPEALGNKVYGGRMGNVQPDDGSRFKGRGFIQLTGRSNYLRYANILGADLVNNPQLAADPDVAARIAGAFWEQSFLNAKADADDLRGITRTINGGETGLDARQAALTKAKSILGIHTA
jgi:putative chitinase